ncbi:hypothetical protein A7981_04920 [Methylovorus sp. MM2]|uniref:PD-(D/E)XK nuclease family protein n=1 Tax=Methylovorus sp. MM2 TaxID=1848038 RepID=UPI0007DF364D|nr:PD-(D/E)XK nuclease family protein [Methylovorus sp. MM2]OAM52788.1 hypothetical protein A7981_04920 [Methylovorus sp. MM2]
MASDDFMIVCSTARLANGLRWVHGAEQVAQGQSQWQPLPALTLSQWLDGLIEQLVLQGDIPIEQLPRKVLTNAQERVLWERVVERMLDSDVASLFDLSGLAASAVDANSLMQEWDIVIQSANYAEEVEQFLKWRDEFRCQCKAAGWLEPTRYLDWQIAHLPEDVDKLPAQLFYAGFDRISPQEQRLFDTLKSRGVAVEPWQHLHLAPAISVKAGLADSNAECRAAVCWAAARLAENPQARLGIVVPELDRLRPSLSALLDDVFHPATVSAGFAETPRDYDFSLGAPLSRHPLIATALDILRLAANRRNVNQQDFSRILLQPYWAAGFTEADARAQLDAAIKAHLPINITLERLLQFTKKYVGRGLLLNGFYTALKTLFDALLNLPVRQLPSAWAVSISALLAQVEWSAERPLSSHEYQARKKFNEVLATLIDFDLLLGSISFSQIVQRLSHLCNEHVFQPETEGDPHIFVMGLLETVAKPMDAIWVMGMNDHVWPPPARPNPLLPAALQRTERAPAADGNVQAAFALSIHRRLLLSAAKIVFSYAHKDGERELRPSPLILGIEDIEVSPGKSATLAEQLVLNKQAKEWMDDHTAPPVTIGEKVSGGAGLIRAQALCPAWAYYRYRLGARRLEEPVEGLDAMGRGNLLHAVLQSFWQGHDSAYLHDLDDIALHSAIARAVDDGVVRFSETLEEPLLPNFLALEKQRLHQLVEAWLACEKERHPFAVVHCEQRVTLDVSGMSVQLTLDRVDRLEDGQLVVIDYKTGTTVSHKSWADDRIAEPQLPIYAAIALSGEKVAAVCFAQVRADVQRFVGVTAESDVLPGVKSLQESSKLFSPASFADWDSLLDHWRTSIQQLASEIISGEAAVTFSDEDDLRDCDVKPLLRLPERQLQQEKLIGADT